MCLLTTHNNDLLESDAMLQTCNNILNDTIDLRSLNIIQYSSPL